jgi:ribosomal protein S18 acetylase RimI-like enzyme
MVHYRFLNEMDREALYSAFLAAFSDYLVDMRMSREQFDYRLLRDGIDLNKSVGAIKENELVGFCISGVGTWQGEKTIYDAGTGVVPQHRRHGIGKEMFNFMLPRLKETGFSHYLLEVITSNEPAVSLYRKLGFIDTRKLIVFRLKNRFENLTTSKADIRKPGVPNWNLYRTFWDVEPSWQNSVEAAIRTAQHNAVLEVHADNGCVGYGVVSRESGNLFQLAVNKHHRGRGFGSLLLNELQHQVVSDEPIKVNNIDESSTDGLSFYKSSGFRVALAQYELIKTF